MHTGSVTALRASMAGVHTVGSATFRLISFCLVLAVSCVEMDAHGERQNVSHFGKVACEMIATKRPKTLK